MILTRYFSLRLLRCHIDVVLLFMPIFHSQVEHRTEGTVTNYWYTSSDAIWYTILMLPGDLLNFDTGIVCLATCLWFLQLRKTQEILISQVFGLSMLRLLARMLPVCLTIIALLTLNREWIAPRLVEYAKSDRASRMSNGAVYVKKNQMWLYTKNGYLKAEIQTNSAQLRNVSYYEFDDTGLTQWTNLPKVDFVRGKWIAPIASQTLLGESQQTTKSLRAHELPIKLKPRVIAWSFLKPSQLSSWRMAESLLKGKKHGIAGEITWILLFDRLARPITLYLVIALTLIGLNKAIFTRIGGLGIRLAGVILCVATEYMVHQSLTSGLSHLSIGRSLGVALLMPALLAVLIISIVLYQKISQETLTQS